MPGDKINLPLITTTKKDLLKESRRRRESFAPDQNPNDPATPRGPDDGRMYIHNYSSSSLPRVNEGKITREMTKYTAPESSAVALPSIEGFDAKKQADHLRTLLSTKSAKTFLPPTPPSPKNGKARSF